MPQPHTKEWTVMFYLAGDNPLAPSIVSQLKSIKDAGYHPEANVVVHFDPHIPRTPTHVFDVNHVAKLKARGGSQVGHANDPSVRNLVLDKVWGAGGEDANFRERISAQIMKSLPGGANGRGPGGGEKSDSEAKPDFALPVLADGLSGEAHPADSLKTFLRFCKETYQARHYILFLLGHGLVVGNKMFMLDEHTAPRRLSPAARARARARPTNGHHAPGDGTDVARALTLKDLADALEVFKPPRGERSRLELIGFHSCSMSGLEVAYELKGKANYMMASQGPAFVGSWPYKQILLRLFNSLNAGLRAADLTDAPALLSRLKTGTDPVSKYVRGRLAEKAAGLLERDDESGAPGAEAVANLVAALRGVLDDPGLCEAEGVASVEMSEPTRRLFERAVGARGRSVKGANRRRLNRLLLADAHPGAIAANPAVDDAYVKRLVTKIFYSVLSNSADFQLAGYSFDLCLCDLSKVGRLGGSVGTLAAALREGMAGGGGLSDDAVPLARELVLLAHWDAQSFWQESYTDLYDFCYRLRRRCGHIFRGLNIPAVAPAEGEDPFAVLRRIVTACEGVILDLGRGADGADDDVVVVRAEFAGAEYQYSHGLSVYFPWARPADGFFDTKYREYAFVRETAWDTFLDEYFRKTQREPFGRENPAAAKSAPEGDAVEAEVLESLLRDIGRRVFTEGQLAKGAGNDATGGSKGAGNDATGECDCPVIKNYPPFTGRLAGAPADAEGTPEDPPISPNVWGASAM